MNQINKKILIVEDDAPLLGALKAKFASEGFNVVTAVDGVEGLAAAVNEHPDLILLDIIMPRMDGLTMMKKLREDAWGKSARIILLTNLSDPGMVMEALHDGAYDFLVKTDWKLEAVVEKVYSVLGLKRGV